MKKKKKKFKNNISMKSINRRYCRCLIHVRSKTKSPYGICTNSVFNLQGKKKSKINCGKNYNFNNFTANELRLYAKEKKINIRKNKKFLTKKAIIRSLKNISRSIN